MSARNLLTPGGCRTLGLPGIAFALLIATAIGAGPAFAQPPVTVDGDLTDLIAYVPSADCGLISDDVPQDVCKTDPAIVPCVAEIACPVGAGTYFVNGFDVLQAVMAYDASADVAYFGFRTVGNIGDSNGDGDPGVGACGNPASNILDLAGIGGTESYIWLLDTNCDGQPNVQVSVSGNTVSVDPPAGATAFAFNGTDLEVSVAGLNLPAIWRLSTFAGSTTDGLSEDTSPLRECPPPNLDLDIEKSANPTTLCPGDATRFTVAVTNTGAAALTVSLEDVLPDGLTYANAVSGDFTVDTVVGQTITFNDLVIPAGESRSVQFDATADQDCFGAVENVATARGSFDSDCLEAPIGVGPVEARATVTCQDDPCVTISCDPASQSVNVGESATINFSATNCSRSPEDITVTIRYAGGVLCTRSFPNVAPGQTVTGSCDFRCEEPGTHDFEVSAEATNACGTDGVEPDICRIECIEEGENCPRTPGFWMQQCAQRGNGSTKFTLAEVTQIAECVDDESAFFDWADGRDFSLFCSKINPERPMNQFKQLQRHFAAMLANICTGDLGLEPNNGGIINLSRSTPIDCDGVDAETIGELIDEIDQALIDGDEEKYGALLECADNINNGVGIPLDPDCGQEVENGLDGPRDLDPREFRLGTPAPNPFLRHVTVPYDVSGDVPQRIEIGVYNVAGRLVRKLVSDLQSPGSYSINWDGTDQGGAKVQRGIYFVRALQNGAPASSAARVLYLR